MQSGDPCWRDVDGTAFLELPFRVVLPDGTTRTDPAQWSADEAVLQATGWHRSALTEADVAAMAPPPPAPVGWVTPYGWRLHTTPDALSKLTGLYVLSARRQQLGMPQAVTVYDTDGTPHSMTFAQFDEMMLSYGAAMEASNGAS